MKHYIGKFIKIFIITLCIFMLAVGIALGGAILGYWGDMDELDVDSLTLNQNSVIVYSDPDTGEEVELQKINSAENREWVNIQDIPDALQKAVISIEDERFMEHKGYDLPRTAKATLTWVWNKITGKKGVSLGGSTITQQLIKNVTGEDDQTPTRKIREISRAVALEKKLDKTQILELYLNCIYLSHGCNGVGTAAKTYFDKDVKNLTLAECASIAGITQNPAAYDPIENPENNKERQMLVLGKMLELGYITESEYSDAAVEKLNIRSGSENGDNAPKTNSYFVDQVILDVIEDLQKAGYSESLAKKIIYSGGVKIEAAYNPKIQEIVEKFYSSEKNFIGTGVQSAITVIDVNTGQIVGIAGGIGEKTASLTLNRASQSPRQPGSTIKPISAYAPAIENGTIYPGSVFDDKAVSYNGWTPRNYDYAYRGMVDVRRALRTSLNTTPVEIINKMGPQTSYDFLTQKFKLSTLVSSRNVNGDIYTDIGLSQLALGGLTDGTTTLEMAAAYASFANGGLYYKPYTYIRVTDREGNEILTSDRTGTPILKESTAYIMTQLLKEVVESGTGRGASISNAAYTAGKTGTTSENMDRWFIGYTPEYVAAIWYGYDTPKEITVGSNPCIPVFRSIMDKVQATVKSSKSLKQPDSVTRINYCAYTGMRATSACPSLTYYCDEDKLPAYCSGKHNGSAVTDESDESDESEKKTESSSTQQAENSDDDDDEDSRQQGQTSSGSRPSGAGTSSGTSSGGTSAGSGTSGGSSAGGGGTSGGGESHVELTP
ncbi:MAG: transglycosylase domain-containing protein [Monoglobaceae bacterium]